MPKAAINGVELYYESHGSGPAMVFAHGRGGNHLSWWQQVPHFSKEYRCITFDHRGWGQSVAEFGSPLRDNFTQDLTGLIDHLGFDQVFLVAQSMGGLSCLEFALANPERTLGLVLGATTGGVVSPTLLEDLDKANPPAEGPRRALAQGFINQYPTATFLYQQIDGLNPERGDDGVLPAFHRADGISAADFADWSVPTMLIAGDEDLIFPVEVIQEAGKIIKGSRVEIVKGAAHSTHFELAKLFNGLVGDFFSQVRTGKTSGAAAD